MQLKAPSRFVRVSERGCQDTRARRAALFLRQPAFVRHLCPVGHRDLAPAAGLSPPLPAARTPGRCARGDAVTCWPVCPPLAALSRRHRTIRTLRTPRRAPRRSARRTRAPRALRICARSRRSQTCRSAERGARPALLLPNRHGQPVFALLRPTPLPRRAVRTRSTPACLLDAGPLAARAQRAARSAQQPTQHADIASRTRAAAPPRAG